MIRLGVNIDHVATIRQARRTSYPDILEAANLVISGGADQITVHLREDRRHIQDEDVRILKKSITVPLNLEMACVDEITDIALEIKPSSVTLVPEKRAEQTTETGLDLKKDFKQIKNCIEKLKNRGILISLFLDPIEDAIIAASDLNVDIIELHTGEYASKYNGDNLYETLMALEKASSVVKKLGMKVAAGHGLNYNNTAYLISKLPEIEEVNIGHSIIARSIVTGLDKAVIEMKGLIL